MHNVKNFWISRIDLKGDLNHLDQLSKLFSECNIYRGFASQVELPKKNPHIHLCFFTRFKEQMIRNHIKVLFDVSGTEYSLTQNLTKPISHILRYSLKEGYKGIYSEGYKINQLAQFHQDYIDSYSEITERRPNSKSVYAKIYKDIAPLMLPLILPKLDIYFVTSKFPAIHHWNNVFFEFYLNYCLDNNLAIRSPEQSSKYGLHLILKLLREFSLEEPLHKAKVQSLLSWLTNDFYYINNTIQDSESLDVPKYKNVFKFII